MRRFGSLVVGLCVVFAGGACVERKQTVVFKVKADATVMLTSVQKLVVVIELAPAEPVDFAVATACERFEMTGDKGPFSVSSTVEQSFSVRFDAHKGERIRWTITAVKGGGAEAAFGQGTFLLSYDKTEVDVVLRGSKPAKGGICASAGPDGSTGPETADRPEAPPSDPVVDPRGEMSSGACDEVANTGCPSGQKCSLDCATKGVRCVPAGTATLGATCPGVGSFDTTCGPRMTCGCDTMSLCNCYRYCRGNADCPAGTTCSATLSCNDMIVYARLCI